jgi:hypothetical protein
MSHREEPRSGRGCFGAVVVVPFLALGGMFALIALTGSPQEAPLAAPPPSRPTSQWWTEPFETGSLSTVTETVVVEGAAREVRAARLATQTRVAVSTVTETVRAGGGKPAATGRNEPPPGPGEQEPTETLPSSSDSSSPVVTSTSSVVPGPPVLEPPGSSVPAEPVVTPTPSTPRSEEPTSPVVPTAPPAPPGSTSPAPPCERGEPVPSVPSVPEEPGAPGEPSGEVSVGGSLELPLPSPAEESSTSSAPLAGV